jgi:uncharacterized membrane protein YgcG
MSTIAVVLLSSMVAAVVPDRPAGFIYDEAALLDGAATERLTRQLASTPEVVVAVLPSLPGKDLAVFAHRLSEAWRIADAPSQRAALVLVVATAPAVRVVGGVYTQLDDAQAARIANHVILPRLEGGDLEGSIREGLRDVEDVLDRAPSPPATAEVEARWRNAGTFIALGLLVALLGWAATRSDRRHQVRALGLRAGG